MCEANIKIQKINIEINSLKSIALYLEGLKQGKGNLLPLGTNDLEQLWNVIKYLQGDVRFECKKLRYEKD